MSKNNKQTKRIEILLIILSIIMFTFMLIMLTVSLSKVDVEWSCKIDKLSFDINETNKFENITLSDGEIDCDFKLEFPLWVILVAR